MIGSFLTNTELLPRATPACKSSSIHHWPFVPRLATPWPLKRPGNGPCGRSWGRSRTVCDTANTEIKIPNTSQCSTELRPH